MRSKAVMQQSATRREPWATPASHPSRLEVSTLSPRLATTLRKLLTSVSIVSLLNTICVDPPPLSPSKSRTRKASTPSESGTPRKSMYPMDRAPMRRIKSARVTLCAATFACALTVAARQCSRKWSTTLWTLSKIQRSTLMLNRRILRQPPRLSDLAASS